MATDTQIIISGPLFDGAASGAVGDFLEEAQYSLGAQGLANAQQYMDQYFKHPTPYYETQVIVQRIGDQVIVHDRGIVYGPWLAGTSARNRTTSFKGYPHWTNAVRDLRAQAPELIEHVLRRYLPRMGGR